MQLRLFARSTVGHYRVKRSSEFYTETLAQVRDVPLLAFVIPSSTWTKSGGENDILWPAFCQIIR